MKMLRVFLFIACVGVFLLTQQVKAQESDWVADTARLSKLSSENIPAEEKCRITWDILWPQAKEGNLEARAELLFLILPPASHSQVMLLPGRTIDIVSRIRDSFIMAVHTTGVSHTDMQMEEIYTQYTNSIYSQFPFDQPRAKTFRSCIKSLPNSDCIDRAIKNGLVPSFEEFAREIDALVAQGMKPRCSYYDD